LIAKGLAYVDDLTPEEMREYRGTLTQPGRSSPHRARSPEENLDLFRRMKAGEFADGSRTLRAKIDMASPNINLRDPVIYRIKRAHHIRTGDTWCIYPMYDYTHCISDALECITHSLCTLEFEDHRPLYDWVLEQIWESLRSTEIAETKSYFRELMTNWVNNPQCHIWHIWLSGKALSMSADPEKRDSVRPLPQGYGHMPRTYTGYSPQFTQVSQDSKLGELLSRDPDSQDWGGFVDSLFLEPWPIVFGVLDEIMGSAMSVIRGGASVIERDLLAKCRLPRQIEFSRLELHYTVTSKRKLNQLVMQKHVDGWDDPRMPTIHGMRRRGYTPAGIREFARRIGISKSENVVDMAVLEGAIREDLETKVPRVMAVLNPLKVVLTNFEEGATTSRAAGFHPNHPEFGEREVPISREIWIEQDDFAETPPPGWQRLTPGGEVRLRYSYVVKCEEVVKDGNGRVVELRCAIDHETLGKNPVGRKVKGVIHWLSAAHALPIEARLYDRLFLDPEPDGHKDRDFLEFLNPDSLTVVKGWAESCVAKATPETRYQFERLGYFCADRYDHQPGGRMAFNRTVTLKDSWSR
jgi:glutamyl/glutaminyl-tRNA synthetase